MAEREVPQSQHQGTPGQPGGQRSLGNRTEPGPFAGVRSTVTADQLPPAVRDAIARLVDYNWADEARDYADCGSGGNSRQGHVYESLVRVRRWLDGRVDGNVVTTEVWVPDPGRGGCMMMARRKSAREVLADITAILGADHDGGAKAGCNLQVCGADREWPEGPVTVGGVAGEPEGRYVHVYVHRVRDGIREADAILWAEFDDLEAGRRLARRLRSILQV